jgi:hypothetical protein
MLAPQDKTYHLMQIYMKILSLALVAMAGVTASPTVRAYYPSLFVCNIHDVCFSTFRLMAILIELL